MLYDNFKYCRAKLYFRPFVVASIQNMYETDIPIVNVR